MKHFISTLFLTFLLSLSFAQTPKKETLIIKTAIHCEHCMQCSSCGQNIHETIRKKNKGISKIKINPKDNTITVTYKSTKTNPNEIRKAISEAGYDADDVKASPNSYAKLDSCCKAR